MGESVVRQTILILQIDLTVQGRNIPPYGVLMTTFPQRPIYISFVIAQQFPRLNKLPRSLFFYLLRFPFPSDCLSELRERYGGNGKGGYRQPFGGGESGHVKQRRERRDGHDCQLECGAQSRADGELSVREDADAENRAARAHIERVSYLAETLRGESHGAPELDAGVFEQRVARDERKQAQRAYQHSLEGYVESRAVGEKALGAVARGTLHNAAVGHLRAEREGGERVGDEIYKEELYRQKRRGHSEERRRKDAEYLADIAAEQIVYRAADPPCR